MYMHGIDFEELLNTAVSHTVQIRGNIAFARNFFKPGTHLVS